MINFFLRDKRKEPLKLEGTTVLLDEISPKYFPYVIKWRNDKNLNRYINQPDELTYESESQWYENIYLKDNTQGFMVMLDKKSAAPFATVGWTDYDSQKRQCIRGRLMLCNPCYALRLIEGYLLLSDYLYEFVDVIYIHISKNNNRSLQLNQLMGFESISGEWEYPSEQKVNGLDMCETFLTAEKHREVRAELIKKFHIVLPENYVKCTVTDNNISSTIETRNTKHETRNTKHETRNTKHETRYVYALINLRKIENSFPVRIFWTGNFSFLNRSVRHDEND